MKQKDEGFDKIGFAATALIVLTAAPFIIFQVPQLMGLDAYVVTSGSMEPSMPTGSIVYNQPAQPINIEVADVITFVSNDSEEPQKITHRVIQVNETEDGRIFKTKGDANPEPDEGWVREEDILGEKAFSIPYLGYALITLSSPFVLIMLLLIPSVILVRRHIKVLMEYTGDNEDDNYSYSSQ